jgi:hypothetical protein
MSYFLTFNIHFEEKEWLCMKLKLQDLYLHFILNSCTTVTTLGLHEYDVVIPITDKDGTTLMRCVFQLQTLKRVLASLQSS